MALQKMFFTSTEVNDQVTLGSGLIGILTSVICVNPTDNSIVFKIQRTSGTTNPVYFYKNVPAKSTVTMQLDIPLDDEVLQGTISEVGGTLIVNYIAS